MRARRGASSFLSRLSCSAPASPPNQTRSSQRVCEQARVEPTPRSHTLLIWALTWSSASKTSLFLGVETTLRYACRSSRQQTCGMSWFQQRLGLKFRCDSGLAATKAAPFTLWKFSPYFGDDRKLRTACSQASRLHQAQYISVLRREIDLRASSAWSENLQELLRALEVKGRNPTSEASETPSSKSLIQGLK